MSKEYLQEIYDKVATHLLTQNKQSRDEKDCLYRDAHGNKCAVGCLITDEAYSTRYERKNVRMLLAPLKKSGVQTTSDVIDLLEKMQFIHDKVDVEWWFVRLREYAEKEGLTPITLPATA